MKSSAVLVLGVFAAVTAASARQFDPGAPSDKPVPGFRSAGIGGRSLRYKCAGELIWSLPKCCKLTYQFPSTVVAGLGGGR